MCFSNMKIGVRLDLGFAMVQALTGVMGVLSISRITSVNEATVDFSTNWMVAWRWLDVYQNAINGIRSAEAQHVMSLTDPQFSSAEKRINETRAQASEALKVYVATVTTDEERILLDAIAVAEKKCHETQPLLLKTSGNTDGMTQELRDVFDGISCQAVTELTATIKRDMKYQNREASKTCKGSQSTYQEAIVVNTTLLPALIFIGTFLAMAITRAIVAPVREALTLAEAVAQGNLTAHGRVGLFSKNSRALA